MVAGEPFERKQRRSANGRAVVVEAAAKQLLLRAEPELADCTVGDCPLAKVGCARRRLEVLVPLRAQLRQLALLALLRQRVGFDCRVGEGAQRSASVRGGGPT